MSLPKCSLPDLRGSMQSNSRFNLNTTQPGFVAMVDTGLARSLLLAFGSQR
jgi:hypothetical protein